MRNCRRSHGTSLRLPTAVARLPVAGAQAAKVDDGAGWLLVVNKAGGAVHRLGAARIWPALRGGGLDAVLAARRVVRGARAA